MYTRANLRIRRPSLRTRIIFKQPNKEHERKLKDKTIDGTEIGIMLSDFSDTELGKKLSESNDVQAEFAKRGIIFPVVLSLAPNGRQPGLWESIRKLMGLN